METFRFKHFSLTFEWWMVLALLYDVVLSADAIVTTCENIQTAAPWWHTMFTAVESIAFLMVLVCLILKALQPVRPERERFYFAVAFVACALITLRTAFSQYWQLFVEDDTHWLKWISGPLAVIGWSCLTYFFGYCCAKAKERKKQRTIKNKWYENEEGFGFRLDYLGGLCSRYPHRPLGPDIGM